MAYRILKGFLSIEGRSPDGDTVAFYLDKADRADWISTRTDSGRFPKFNRNFQTNVRFEGVTVSSTFSAGLSFCHRAPLRALSLNFRCLPNWGNSIAGQARSEGLTLIPNTLKNLSVSMVFGWTTKCSFLIRTVHH